jgi:hypothetical protein
METKKASVIVFDIETYSTRDPQMIEKTINDSLKLKPTPTNIKRVACALDDCEEEEVSAERVKALKGAWHTSEVRAARGALAVAKTALDPMLASVLVVAYSVDGSDHVTEIFATAEGERAGLENLAEEWDDLIGPDTLLVGHNIAGFDMPVLLGAWNRHDIEPPDLFPSFSRGRFHGNFYDTMQQIPNNNGGFVGLELACRAMGLSTAKSVLWKGEPMDGGRVAQAFEECEFDLLREYCAADVEAELRLFLRLTHGGSYGLSRRSDSVREALEPIWASETLDRAQKKIASFDALRQLGVIPQGIAV